jgi:hypothetical protein
VARRPYFRKYLGRLISGKERHICASVSPKPIPPITWSSKRNSYSIYPFPSRKYVRRSLELGEAMETAWKERRVWLAAVGSSCVGLTGELHDQDIFSGRKENRNSFYSSSFLRRSCTVVDLQFSHYLALNRGLQGETFTWLIQSIPYQQKGTGKGKSPLSPLSHGKPKLSHAGTTWAASLNPSLPTSDLFGTHVALCTCLTAERSSGIWTITVLNSLRWVLSMF